MYKRGDRVEADHTSDFDPRIVITTDRGTVTDVKRNATGGVDSLRVKVDGGRTSTRFAPNVKPAN